MDTFFIIFKNVLIFIALAMPGFILVKSKILKSTDSGALSKLLTYVALPFLILTSTMDLELSSDNLTTLGICFLVGAFITVVFFFITALLTIKTDNPKTRGMMRFAMTLSNNGFLGIPLVFAISSSQITISVVIIINILTNIAIYTLGVYLISNDKRAMNVKKAFFNPVLIAAVIGIAFNLLGVKNVVPEVSTFSVHLKNLVTPLSMIILGMKLADIKISALFTSKSNYYVSLIKLILMPIFAVAVALAVQVLFNLPREIIIGFYIAFAMPTAGLASTLSDNYNGDTNNAVIFTLGTTILSVITIPVLYVLASLI